MKTRSLYILAIAVVAFMVAGQVMIYGVNPYHTEASSRSIDGGIEYEVSSNTNSDYDALLIDTGMSIPDGLMIYKDNSYVSHYSEQYLDDKTDLICSELSVRNVSYTVVDAQQMKEAMEEDIANGETDMRLLMQVGILPDTVYQGNSEDLIFKWLEIGGVLYWTGYSIGYAVSSLSGIVPAGSGYGANFLGISDSDIRMDENARSLYATEKAADYGIGEDLAVMYNDSTFGINTQNLTDCISIGFTSEGYDSLVLTKYQGGVGMIVIFGGKPAVNTAPIVAQVIASKLTYKSVIAEHDSGTLYHSAEKRTMETDPSKNYVLYIYVGIPQIYARAFSY